MAKADACLVLCNKNCSVPDNEDEENIMRWWRNNSIKKNNNKFFTEQQILKQKQVDINRQISHFFQMVSNVFDLFWLWYVLCLAELLPSKISFLRWELLSSCCNIKIRYATQATLCITLLNAVLNIIRQSLIESCWVYLIGLSTQYTIMGCQAWRRCGLRQRGMIDWLNWLIDWLHNQLINWLISRLIKWLIG